MRNVLDLAKDAALRERLIQSQPFAAHQGWAKKAKSQAKSDVRLTCRIAALNRNLGQTSSALEVLAERLGKLEREPLARAPAESKGALHHSVAGNGLMNARLRMTNPAAGHVKLSTCLPHDCFQELPGPGPDAAVERRDGLTPASTPALLLCDRVDGCFEASGRSLPDDHGGKLLGIDCWPEIRLQIYLPGTEYGRQTVRDRQIVPAMWL